MTDKASREDRPRDSQENRQRASDMKKDTPKGLQPVEKPGFAWGNAKSDTGSQSGGSEGGLGGG